MQGYNLIVVFNENADRLLMCRRKKDPYKGKLNKYAPVAGDENELYWSVLDEDFFDTSLYAGQGNIGHILNKIGKME